MSKGVLESADREQVFEVQEFMRTYLVFSGASISAVVSVRGIQRLNDIRGSSVMRTKVHSCPVTRDVDKERLLAAMAVPEGIPLEQDSARPRRSVRTTVNPVCPG
jgi:hypothetical protein